MMTLGQMIAILKTRDPMSGIGACDPQILLGAVSLTEIPAIEDWISVAELLEQLEAINNSTVDDTPIEDITHVWLGRKPITGLTDINNIITE